MRSLLVALALAMSVLGGHHAPEPVSVKSGAKPAAVKVVAAPPGDPDPES